MIDTSSRQTCAGTARAAHEPLFATAPESAAWLLLEHPGPWGSDALTESSLDPQVAAELERLSKEVGFKVLFVRRSRARAANRATSAFLVRSAQGETWMERLQLAGFARLLDIDLSTLAGPVAPGIGEPAEHLWAVCTHGRRDPCCAEHGRRLVRLGFGDGLGENLWESSHQGGHRFAANLALFPHGLFYGMVEPQDARRIVDAYRDGRVVLDHYRGRSAFGRIVQAADYLARREDSITGIDDLVPQEVEELGNGRHEVSFTGPAGFRKVRLEVSDGPMRPESCNKPKLTPVKLYRELEISPEIREFPTI